MNNYCFATVITKAHYAIGAGRIYQALHYFGSKYPFEILVANSVSVLDLQFLTKNNIPYRFCTKLQFCDPFYDGGPYPDTLSKFNILNLEKYDYVCFLDSDLLLTANIDWIFDEIDTSKDFNLYTRIGTTNFLGEVFLARPNKDILNILIKHYHHKNIVEADEVLLSQLHTFNYSIKSLGMVHTEEKFKVVHLSGFIKFWELLRDGDFIYDWFYNNSIEDFINFLEKHKQAISEFRFKSSQALETLFVNYCDLLVNVRNQL